jgi:hypothetical protein
MYKHGLSHAPERRQTFREGVDIRPAAAALKAPVCNAAASTARANACKNAGDYRFKCGQFHAAINEYRRGVEVLEPICDLKEEHRCASLHPEGVSPNQQQCHNSSVVGRNE